MYFSFQTEWVLSRLCCPPNGTNKTILFFHFAKEEKIVLQLLNPDISFYIFFFPSLTTIANNFSICIALIAVIKQTQQTPTLHRASSQPHSQLGLYFVSGEGDRSSFVLE